MHQPENQFLASKGIRVLRFKDDAIHSNPDHVAAQILEALREGLAQ